MEDLGYSIYLPTSSYKIYLISEGDLISFLKRCIPDYYQLEFEDGYNLADTFILLGAITSTKMRLYTLTQAKNIIVKNILKVNKSRLLAEVILKEFEIFFNSNKIKKDIDINEYIYYNEFNLKQKTYLNYLNKLKYILPNDGRKFIRYYQKLLYKEDREDIL